MQLLDPHVPVTRLYPYGRRTDRLITQAHNHSNAAGEKKAAVLQKRSSVKLLN